MVLLDSSAFVTVESNPMKQLVPAHFELADSFRNITTPATVSQSRPTTDCGKHNNRSEVHIESDADLAVVMFVARAHRSLQILASTPEVI
jgi:hypothetical protein